jgi:hypothetical protein
MNCESVQRLQQVYLRLCRIAAAGFDRGLQHREFTLTRTVLEDFWSSYQKLPMKPPGNKINRTAIGVAGRIIDELVIEAEFDRGGDGDEPVCGRPDVGKDFLKHSACAGRCGHVSGLFMRPFHAPLAIMPFARLRSQSVPLTRSAGLIVGFPEPAVSTGFVHSLLSALPNFRGASAGF